MDKIQINDKNEIKKIINNPQQPKMIKKIYEIFFIIVLSINIFLSIFDFLYLHKLPYYHGTLRDILIHYYPESLKNKFNITDFWDSLKGISPHRFNLAYETHYLELKELYYQLSGSSPQERANLLNQIEEKLKILTELSHEMIDKRGVESHFYLARKDGILEKIKNKMRNHLPNPENSAKQSFEKFFSKENLSLEKFESEFAFFEKEILFYIRENYFRWIDEDGEFKDYFYKIDRWFVLFFIIDFLGRWIILGRNYRKWYIFPIRHFYEVFNLYPPHHFSLFRLLRIIPLYIRLRENQFISDAGILPEIIHNNANLIAEEISGLVIINAIDRTINLLKNNQSLNLEPQTFESLKKLLQNQAYVFSYKVMPEIEPLITESVQYSINRAMEPYLLSPIGPIIRIILLNVHASVKEGLEAIFSGPEGLERINRIVSKSISDLIDQIQYSDNQKMIIENVIQFLEVLKKDIENNFETISS